mgnify:FL=1|tara:strand:- start:1278 stop:2600 length:1323 start_codon:yes stop_codon:yes gene_type:complete
MNITVIGCGYVGLVTGACLADIGHNVVCIDNNKSKIKSLIKGKITIYENGLEKLINYNIKEKRLAFTSSYKTAVNHSDIIFLAVDTPPKKDGAADLTNIKSACTSISNYMSNSKIIVEKSTVPVGTSLILSKLIKSSLKKLNKQVKFSIISNPEFLKEGVAIDDFMKPDRIIIGLDDDNHKEIFNEIYKPFNRKSNKIQFMSVSSAELTKYASNAILATKISFINEMANLAELLDVDIEDVRIGIGTDRRIGNEFLYPGCGYGGSCFPKDIEALLSIAKKNNFKMNILESVRNVNNKQKEILFKKIFEFHKKNLKNKTIAVWGLSFKPKTDDIRDAPSIKLIQNLLSYGATVRAYDPVATLKHLFKSNRYKEFKSAKLAIKDSDSLAICTEWKEFWSIDPIKLKKLLAKPVIFDGRNIYSPDIMSKNGITYIGVGRNNLD